MLYGGGIMVCEITFLISCLVALATIGVAWWGAYKVEWDGSSITHAILSTFAVGLSLLRVYISLFTELNEQV